MYGYDNKNSGGAGPKTHTPSPQTPLSGPASSLMPMQAVEPIPPPPMPIGMPMMGPYGPPMMGMPDQMPVIDGLPGGMTNGMPMAPQGPQLPPGMDMNQLMQLLQMYA